MDKVIFFEDEGQRVDRCCGQVYRDFLDYVFQQADYFMLVYVNYYGKGYTKVMKSFKDLLKPYQVKRRTNPSWPGVSFTSCIRTTYQIVFYRTTEEAKEILKKVEKLSDWSRPSHPQDLAFFKGNQCWFYSVGHEKLGGFIHASKQDIDFVVSKNLATRENVYIPTNHDFDLYDEILEK